jgi:hypothetical protein
MLLYLILTLHRYTWWQRRWNGRVYNLVRNIRLKWGEEFLYTDLISESVLFFCLLLLVAWFSKYPKFLVFKFRDLPSLNTRSSNRVILKRPEFEKYKLWWVLKGNSQENMSTAEWNETKTGWGMRLTAASIRASPSSSSTSSLFKIRLYLKTGSQNNKATFPFVPRNGWGELFNHFPAGHDNLLLVTKVCVCVCVCVGGGGITGGGTLTNDRADKQNTKKSLHLSLRQCL